MARIRTVKPEYWQDEKLAPLSPVSRLVFLGLISQADDAGRIVDSVKYIDGLLFAFTDDSCGASLDVLHERGVIERGYTESGQPVIQIVNWKHQKIDKPNLSAALPEIARKREKQAIPVEPQGFAETSSKDRRNVADASTPHICTNDQLSVSTTTDEASPVVEKVEEHVLPIAPKLNTRIVIDPKNIGAAFTLQWFREKMWGGDSPPEWCPFGWGVGRELSVIKQLHAKGFALEDIYYAVPEFLRKAMGLPSTEKLSFLGVNARDKRYNVGIAIDMYHKAIANKFESVGSILSDMLASA